MKCAAALLLILCLILTRAQAEDIAASDYLKRAYEKRKTGNLAGALADCEKAIELSPDDFRPYWSRGICSYEQERWDLAVADFRKAAELKGLGRAQIHLLIWAARAQMGERDAANKEIEREMIGPAEKSNAHALLSATDSLDKAANALETGRGLSSPPKPIQWKKLPGVSTEVLPNRLPLGMDNWSLAAAKFLIGRINEADFFSVPPPLHKDIATRMKYWPAGKRSCEALFYAGLKRLLDGDNEKAVKYFKECATADGPNELIERELAKAKLQSMH